MPDNLTPEDRLKTMRAVKGKNTGLERSLFSMLAGMRLKGWRKNADNLAGKPDVAFDEPRIAIFIDGCFWHGCPYCQRPMPQTNVHYWQRKIAKNVERANRFSELLRQNGWRVVRIWEHEMRGTANRKLIRARIRQSMSGGSASHDGIAGDP